MWLWPDQWPHKRGGSPFSFLQLHNCYLCQQHQLNLNSAWWMQEGGSQTLFSEMNPPKDESFSNFTILSFTRRSLILVLTRQLRYEEYGGIHWIQLPHLSVFLPHEGRRHLARELHSTLTLTDFLFKGKGIAIHFGPQVLYIVSNRIIKLKHQQYLNIKHQNFRGSFQADILTDTTDTTDK